MAIIELTDLIKPISRDQALADIITLAEGMNLNATSWRIGEPSRFWIMALAETSSRASTQTALIATQSFNNTAFGNGLSKFSKSRFDSPRVGAVKTQGTILLTDAGNVGPITFTAGERVFVFADDPKITYRNITGGTLTLGSTLELTLEAETGGADRNVANDTITEMNPTIAGVTVNNPADPTTWITTEGTDEETDPALQKRNPTKWSTLSGAPPAGAYEFWALTATTNPDGSGDAVGMTRVFVDDQNPGGPGTIFVYIADSLGTATMAQIDDVQAYIDARKGRTALVTVFGAVQKSVTVLGTFHVKAGLEALRKATIEADVIAYLNGIPIGGENIGGALGQVLVSAITEVAMAPPDVIRTAVTLPLVDVDVQANEVVIVSGVTFTAVSV